MVLEPAAVLLEMQNSPLPEWIRPPASTKLKWVQSGKLSVYSSVSSPEHGELFVIRTLMPGLNGMDSKPEINNFALFRALARPLRPAIISKIHPTAATALYTRVRVSY